MNRRFSVLALGAILGALLAMGGCAFDTDPAACEDDLDCDAAWESDDQALGGPDYAHDLDEEIVPQRGDLRAAPPLAEESAALTATGEKENPDPQPWRFANDNPDPQPWEDRPGDDRGGDRTNPDPQPWQGEVGDTHNPDPQPWKFPATAHGSTSEPDPQPW